MTFSKALALILTSLVLLSSHSQAKQLRIMTFPIPLMVENDKKGLFIDLTREIAKRNNLDIKIEVIPTGKSILAFSSGQADGLFPALDVYSPKDCVKTEHFYEKEDFIFYRHGVSLSTIKSLEGKKVGLTFRYPYGQELLANKKIKFEYEVDDITNMQKLGRGEIDAFVVEERSGLKALQLSKAQNIEYNKRQAVSRQAVYYAFQNTPEGRNLGQLFSSAINAMKGDGTFQKIMAGR